MVLVPPRTIPLKIEGREGLAADCADSAGTLAEGQAAKEAFAESEIHPGTKEECFEAMLVDFQQVVGGLWWWDLLLESLIFDPKVSGGFILLPVLYCIRVFLRQCVARANNEANSQHQRHVQCECQYAQPEFGWRHGATCLKDAVQHVVGLVRSTWQWRWRRWGLLAH